MRHSAFLLATCALLLCAAAVPAQQEVDFNRDIRPILSNNCFTCHGPDANTRKAGLRLDLRDGAMAMLAPDTAPIVPGQPDASEVIARVSSDDDDFRMPPPETEKRLTPAQIETLRAWIEQGAPWREHWSFIAPDRPELPREAPNVIDAFIDQRLDEIGLRSAPRTDRATLIRRLSFDLTGLPPSPEDVRTFLDDDAPDAYGRLVNRLMDSPHHGERMAMQWLDAARYADTNGYHIDNERFMWRWRDWVIDAFNSNMPFDHFTRAQLAGDLIGATPDDHIATGFNRNHMINFEGGAIPEEYLTEYIIDRVNTTSTVWLGLTMGCARCHDHKYDPISQEEFYRFYAFFNTVEENGLDGRAGNSAPVMDAPDPEQAAALERVLASLREAKAERDGPMPVADAQQLLWEERLRSEAASSWQTLAFSAHASSGGAELVPLPDGSVRVTGPNPDTDIYELIATTDLSRIGAIQLETLTDESLFEGGPGRAPNGNFVLTGIEIESVPVRGSAEPAPVRLVAAHADFSQKDFPVTNAIDADPATGWAVEGHAHHEDRLAIFVPERPFGYEGGTRLRLRLRHESIFGAHAIGRFRIAVTDDLDLHAQTAPSVRRPWSVMGPFEGEDLFAKAFPPEHVVDLASVHPSTGYRWVERPDLSDGQVHALSDAIGATYLFREIIASSARPMTISLGSDDALKVWVNGELVHAIDVRRAPALDQDTITISLHEGVNRLLMKVVNYAGGSGFSFRTIRDDGLSLPLDILSIVGVAREDRTEGHAQRLKSFYRSAYAPRFAELGTRIEELEEEEQHVRAAIPTVMVMRDGAMPRPTRILMRGLYDQPGAEVTPGVPAILPSLPETVDDTRTDRLALANWLVDPSHPLTSRVAVNRLWQMLFGVGLVHTPEDFGIQGAWPSHPDLLDWLAVEFVECGWDVRHMLRLMVASEAYRRSAVVDSEALLRDPGNRLLARGPRYRLSAEMVRDNALAVSGLLVPTIGGPSVRPYQPADSWRDVAYDPTGKEFSAQVYKQDAGDALYRRSMYTFWKRSSPPPSLAIFDAPNREICTVRRSRTNTPLQALALMNDPTYVEAARALAERSLALGELDDETRLGRMFGIVLARRPSAPELDVLIPLMGEQRSVFVADPDRAVALVDVGESRAAEEWDRTELATWTIMASILLNLDETVTRN